MSGALGFLVKTVILEHGIGRLEGKVYRGICDDLLRGIHPVVCIP
jgi:hypothetical protein